MFKDTVYSQFIYKSRYARYIEKESRREEWPETVKRYMDFVTDFLKTNNGYTVTDELRAELETAIVAHEVMPSMRALMTAGAAAKNNHIAMYNCAFHPIDDMKAFDEEMAILMSGTGDGFSVESVFVKHIPELPEAFYETDTTVVFDDSRIGWAKGYREFISILLTGQIPKWDVSRLRPAGARLKTMGGRCLSGDTIVYKDRKKDRGFNEVTIKKLFDIQNESSYRFNQISLRSLDEENGEFFRNRLLAVHENGVRDVYEVVTRNGYRIKSTLNHRFMNDLGEYQHLSDFEVGDSIAVNGSFENKTGVCLRCGDNVSRRAIRCVECNRLNSMRDNCTDTTTRRRAEVLRYKEQHTSCELCYSGDDLECHHKDGNPHNNVDENLQVLCIPCHRNEDMKRIHFGDPYSCRYMMHDEIIAINHVGLEQTYDLEMEGPNHNFVANGFISHNSSGPEPLVDLLKFTIQIFKKAHGRKLTTVEAHDLGCKVADIVVVGGVRRSALISLSDLSDDRMRDAKSGQWGAATPYRRLANNSAVYDEKPNIGTFMREWLALYDSKSGERGIFSRYATRKVIENANRFREYLNTVSSIALRVREIGNWLFGTNPCSEIILRPNQFCNLTSVQIYALDTPETIARKVRLATILGTFQSCFTNFKYINKKWKQNCEDERLLGVSLNGIYDNEWTNGRLDSLDERLTAWKTVAILTNNKLAREIGINPSVAITCVKPEGTTSAFNGTSSGIHPSHAPFYIRYVRNDKKDPLTAFMIDAGFPYERDAYDPNNVVAFKFPIKSSDQAVFKDEVSAIEHLELWLRYQKFWCEHKPSITVSVKEDEWLKVGAWCYEHFDWLSGVSFLPAEEGTTVYKQAPFTTCDETEYQALADIMPTEVDWTKLTDYEKEDETTNAMDLACSGGGCLV